MVNKVILIGNVGIDPEVRSLENGTKVARVRLATTERLFDRQTNETKEHTEWHTITLWRGLADVVDRYVRKGTQLYIEGRLRTREWMDKDGNKRYTTEILADTMNLLDVAATTPPRPKGLRGMEAPRRRTAPTASRRRVRSPGRQPLSLSRSLSPLRRPSCPRRTPTTFPSEAAAADPAASEPARPECRAGSLRFRRRGEPRDDETERDTG